jgi:hypothetical protein
VYDEIKWPFLQKALRIKGLSPYQQVLPPNLGIVSKLVLREGGEKADATLGKPELAVLLSFDHLCMRIVQVLKNFLFSHSIDLV